MSEIELEVLPDAGAVAERAARLLVEQAARGGHVALAGGSTPRRAYRLAAERLSDWSAATLWLGDERLVASDDERSNLGMVRRELVDVLPAGGRPALQAVRTDLGLEPAAADYAARLHDALGDRGRLDLALLGLGPDAHTASLFPGKPEALDAEQWVVAVPVPGLEPRVPRVSLTLAVLAAARQVAFLVAGADKAQAMVRAFGSAPDPASPAAHVRPRDGQLLVLCDEAAAALVSGA